MDLESQQQSISSHKKHFFWTSEEDSRLISCISEYGTKWMKISQQFSNRNIAQCQQRWKKLKPQTLKKRPWTIQEDQKIQQLYQQIGPKWALIAKSIPGRKGSQVRLRYINQLDSKLQNWTPEEDSQLYQSFIENGCKWKEITQDCFPNRTANNVKNRFHSCIMRTYFGVQNPYQINQSHSQAMEQVLKMREQILSERNQQSTAEEDQFIMHPPSSQESEEEICAMLQLAHKDSLDDPYYEYAY